MITEPLYRQDEIVRMCTGKSVLHLGFILHDQWRERLAEGNWLHSQILAVAESVVGIDYLESEVEAIRTTVGCECYTGDVMRLGDVELKEKFEVIVCGELIEHIESARDLLDGIKGLCHEGTDVIITTPNPWDRKWAANMKAGKLETEWANPEHVAWYSMMTLTKLLERCGYVIIRAEHYFENSRELDASLTGIGRQYWLLKRLARRIVTRPQCQPGLFFVTRPKAADPQGEI